MKIQIVRVDGSSEVITLVPPLTVHDNGPYMAHIHCGDGTDHFFYADEERYGVEKVGRYDGWGRALDTPIAITEGGGGERQVADAIKKIEAERDIR